MLNIENQSDLSSNLRDLRVGFRGYFLRNLVAVEAAGRSCGEIEFWFPTLTALPLPSWTHFAGC